MKKRNCKMRKALLMALCALALVAISVGATIAYLTDTAAVNNTFTVGKVGISLDEADTDDSTPGEARDTDNKYHLIPGKTYDKDPTVHVDANSEPSWLFVKVENDIEPIEEKADYSDKDGNTANGTIAEQMTAFGWTKLTGVDGVDNVWYQKHETKSAQAKDYVVFKNFKVSGNAHNLPPESISSDATEEEKAVIGRHNSLILESYQTADDGPVINVTAYAIQMAGFENDPAGAWEAGNWN